MRIESSRDATVAKRGEKVPSKVGCSQKKFETCGRYLQMAAGVYERLYEDGRPDVPLKAVRELLLKSFLPKTVCLIEIDSFHFVLHLFSLHCTALHVHFPAWITFTRPLAL
jgi:hypothetical protein